MGYNEADPPWGTMKKSGLQRRLVKAEDPYDHPLAATTGVTPAAPKT
jgi:hypothetical protein